MALFASAWLAFYMCSAEKPSHHSMLIDDSNEGLTPTPATPTAPDHRVYFVSSGRSSAENADCGIGASLVTISSAAEQRAAYAAAVLHDSSEGGEFLYIGATFRGDQFGIGHWAWNDDTNLSEYSNLAYGKIDTDPYVTQLCMSKLTGKWKPCMDELWQVSTHYALCQEHKQISITSTEAEAQIAQRSCPLGHVLAMPKSIQELNELKAALATLTGSLTGQKVYLGAQKVPHQLPTVGEHWEWFDGTRVSSSLYENWAGSEDANLTYLCADIVSGNPSACDGQHEWRSACEKGPVKPHCPKGSLTGTDLAVNDTVEFRGKCYYIGESEDNCYATCQKQTGGYCSEAGLKAAATHRACAEILFSFELDVETGTHYSSHHSLKTSAGCVLGQSLDIISGGENPSCSSVTSSIHHRRVCSCNSISNHVYDASKMLLDGETLRITGTKALTDIFDLFMHGANRTFKITPNNNVSGTIVTTLGWCEGGCYDEPLRDRPFDKAWHVDIVLSKTGCNPTWQVVVNGINIVSMERPREMFLRIDGLNSVNPDVSFAVIQPDIIDAGSEVSYDVANGCVDHDVELTKVTGLTINFDIKFLSFPDHSEWKNMACIRCEDGGHDGPTNLVMVGNQMAISLRSHDPHFREFVPSIDFEFEIDTPYSIEIAYDRFAEAVVLRVNNVQVAEVKYTSTAPLDIHHGAVGCSNAFQNHQCVTTSCDLDGQVAGFTMRSS